MLRKLILFGLCLFLLAPVFAQPGESSEGDPVSDEKIIRQRSVLLKTQEDLLVGYGEIRLFPMIHTRAYFEDDKALDYLQEVREIGDPTLLDITLQKYIADFGVENFQRDVHLLWEAGHVKQELGDTAGAIFFYELAEVHRLGAAALRLNVEVNEDRNITLIEIRAPKASDWIPVEEYKQLLELRKRLDPLIPPKNVLESMGKAVNSIDADYAPFMHPTDSVLIFTSRRDTSGKNRDEFVDPYERFNEEIYFSERDFMVGTWRPAQRLSNDINSQFNEGSACLSPDGKTLYFTRCESNDGLGDCDIMQATYEGGEWIGVHNLGKNINSRSWDSQPNISADGKTLFFSSNRPGGFGGTDIYMAQMNEEGRWGLAQNLGPIINTPRSEVTPFFHRINGTLYFGSTGHLKSYGGYDIFKSRYIGVNWEPPHNLGPLVNTAGNEYYFSIDGAGKTIFYSNAKDREEDHVDQNFDIWSFPMPMEARPDAIAKLRGVLVDSVSGYTLQGTVMIVDLDNGVEVAPKRINDLGYFEFDLVNNNRYRLYVLGDNFLTIRKDFTMSNDTTFEVLTESISQDKPIVFESMEFGSNSARLKSNIRPNLDYIVRFLETYPMFNLVVEGHTDSDGRDESNMRLSQERATAIRDYITERGGFDEDRVSAIGYGETRPLVPNDSDDNKQQNRRVEFKMVFNEAYQQEEEIYLPMEEELFFDTADDLIDEWEGIDTGFEWADEERDAWDEELLISDEIDLEAELEADILRMMEDEVDPNPPILESSSEEEEELPDDEQ